MKLLSKKTLSTIACVSLLTCVSQFSFAQPNSVEQTSTTKISQKAEQSIVNLNKSNLDELLTLKGIGKKKAQAILSYRKQIGNFTSIKELAQVKGVGVKIISDNKARLVI